MDRESEREESHVGHSSLTHLIKLCLRHIHRRIFAQHSDKLPHGLFHALQDLRPGAAQA